MLDAEGRGDAGVGDGEPDFLPGLAARDLVGAFVEAVGFAAGERGVACFEEQSVYCERVGRGAAIKSCARQRRLRTRETP